MAYVKNSYRPGSLKRKESPVFMRDVDDFQMTSVPAAVASWILESIDFRESVNASFEWDPVQCNVAPGDAMKAMVMTMVMTAERPALENVAGRFHRQPLELYFDTVTRPADLSPDMLARTLTRYYEYGTDRLFSSVSLAMRAKWGIVTKAVHSDTTSVSVQGIYDRYDSDGDAMIRDSEGNLILDTEVMHITEGYSKDHRPDLKQYMIGEVVDDNGLPILSKPLDGNTDDRVWNAQCLEMLEDMLKEQNLIYVADSKLASDPLVSSMMRKNISFLTRCPANFDELLLERTLMTFDLDSLTPMDNVSKRKDAAKRRYSETVVDYSGGPLRAILVETSTLAGRGEKAVEKENASFLKRLDGFQREYHCKADAEKAFGKFLKRNLKGIFDISAEYEHRLEEHRPRGRPKKDGSDIRRMDIWTVNVSYEPNPVKVETLRRKKGYILLLSNVPTLKKDPENGMDAEALVRLYANEWKVEGSIRTKKRPVLAERLYVKDPARAEALVSVVCIAALVRGMMQLLMRRGISCLTDGELPKIGRSGAPLQRNVTVDYFMNVCSDCQIRYDPATHAFRFLTSEDMRSMAFLDLMGIPMQELF